MKFELSNPKRRLKYLCLFLALLTAVMFTTLPPARRTNTSPDEHKFTRLETNALNTFSEWQNHSMDRYIIYSCNGRIGKVHCSGWGNRLIGIVALYILANVTDRKLGIIMDNPCNLADFLVPNIYNWSVSAESLASRSSISMDVRNNHGFTNGLKKLNFNAEFPQDVVYMASNQDYHFPLLKNKLYRKRLHWITGRSTALVYKHVLETLFKPHRNIQSRLDVFLAKVKKDPGRTLICAQIRLGKNPTIPWDNRSLNTLKSVGNIWRFFRERRSKNWIFVTTDSQQVRDEAKSMFGVDVLDTEGEIIHMDKAYRGDICRGMTKLILDQWILMNCATLVISASSFGRIPAFVRGTSSGLYLFSNSTITQWNPFRYILH